MDVRIVSGGQNNTPITAATLRRLPGGNPLDVSFVGPSGEQYLTRSSTANYGRKNITTVPTKVIASNPLRLGCWVQNLESQQAIIGWDQNLSVANPGGILTPTANSSGDGGVAKITDYTGDVYMVVASGDLDVAFSEFVR